MVLPISNWKKKYKRLASSRGTPQENDAKFKFAIHPQGIRQFHDICKIAKCQTVATLAPKGVFKRGGVQTPPEIFRFFWKSEGKELERKRNGGGGYFNLIVNIFFGIEIFFE